MDNLVHLATYLADQARAVSRAHFRTPLPVDLKPDQTPVTKADKEVEALLRRIIETERPLDGIVGEEEGEKPSRNGYTWVLDPIDGTKSFTIGRPTFATLIALCHNDEPVIGVIDQPIASERWIGAKGCPTTFNGSLVSTRACADLKQAIAATGTAAQIGQTRHDKIAAATRYMVYQGDAYFYGLLSNGFIDLIVEDHMGLYDFLALAPVINGAGGMVTDWNGSPLTLKSGKTVIAAGDARIHQKAIELIRD